MVVNLIVINQITRERSLTRFKRLKTSMMELYLTLLHIRTRASHFSMPLRRFIFMLLKFIFPMYIKVRYSVIHCFRLLFVVDNSYGEAYRDIFWLLELF